MEKEPITVRGLEKLKEELIFLKEKKRPEIVAAIAEARSHGDLKENAEYHAAKEQQSHNEGRVQEVEDIIARANVIDVSKLDNDGKVIFGSTIMLQNLDTEESLKYKIVGKDEANLKEKLIYLIREIYENNSILDTITKNQRQYSDKNVYNNIDQILKKIIDGKN